MGSLANVGDFLLEIDLLILLLQKQEELKFVHGLQPASRSCKEVADFVVANSDPLITSNRKIQRSCRFWKWLCNLLNFSWICCVGCIPRYALTASHAAAVVAFRGVLHARIALADVDALVPTVSRQTRVSVVPRTLSLYGKLLLPLLSMLLAWRFPSRFSRFHFTSF
ncbi:hypothetical protein C3L33_03511, partial [Rhododendron williamsianum]